MDIIESLRLLCESTAPSGFEHRVADLAAQVLEPYVDEVYVNHMNNVIGVIRCGKKDAKKLMLVAHIDEIGLMVTGHDEGQLRFTNVGGVDRRMLPSREVTVLTEPPLFGVIGTVAPHVLTEAQRNESIPMEDLRIDVGLTQEQAVEAVPVGTPVSFRTELFTMGEDTVVSKSMDDRSCFVSLCITAELLKDRKLPWDVYIVGSACEELGYRGAIPAAYGIDPDVAIAVDVCHAWTPDVKPQTNVSELAEGPVITMGPGACPAVTRSLKRVGKEHRIPFQMAVQPRAGGTDAAGIQIIRDGVAVETVSLPLRYMHTPLELGSITDMKLLGALLAEFAVDPGEEVLSC